MRSSNCDYRLKWLLEDENGKKRQKTKKHFSRRSEMFVCFAALNKRKALLREKCFFAG